MPWQNDPASRRRDAKVYGPEWRRARKRQLEADGYRCQLGLPGCTIRATEVDHVHGADADPHHRVLRSVCANCHRKRTAEQGGGYRNRDPRRSDPDPRPRTQW